jgi:hypothetical protein
VGRTKGLSMGFVSALMAASAILTPATGAVPTEHKPVTMFGIGNQSCAAATSKESQPEAYAWLAGYFSGRNRGASAETGRLLDSKGIWSEIDLYCKDNPSIPLFQAAEQIYRNLEG